METTMIPKSALPIARYIRENVERPKELPTFPPYSEDKGDLRWYKDEDASEIEFCPMGFLSEARDPLPTCRKDFNSLPKGFSERAIVSFGKWWDRQADPQAAIDAIWNEE